MDAFLTIEAQQTLRAVKAIAPRRNAAGLLIGHKRGRRFFVEKAFPVPRGFQPSLKNLEVLDTVFEGRIIGFFHVNPGEKDERTLLQPFACGKLFLAIESRSAAASVLIGYLIDYDGRYVLEQIPITLEAALPKKGRIPT
ncbi:MAG: hypothetical protein Q8O91_03725 [Candidatus Aminicenantes bacterium]|nr:hypothetical protein [Candidatus Aminicenantes bacterium]